MSSGSLTSQASATMAVSTVALASDSAATAVVAAGAIPVAIQQLGSTSDDVMSTAAVLLKDLAPDSPRRQQAIHSAGGIPALVRVLHPFDSTDAVRASVLSALCVLAADSPERSRAIAAGGAAAACVQVVEPFNAFGRF